MGFAPDVRLLLSKSQRILFFVILWHQVFSQSDRTFVVPTWVLYKRTVKKHFHCIEVKEAILVRENMFDEGPGRIEIINCRHLSHLILPQGEDDTKGIESLCIIKTGITMVPREIGFLTELTDLTFTSNYSFTQLPTEIGQLRHLKRLHISWGSLESLPQEVGLLPLTVLDLNNNKLRFIPSEIGKLTDLRKLKLHSNRLCCLPTELGELASLRMLELSWNQLTHIPSELGKLGQLKKLTLEWNKLTSLPQSLLRLSSPDLRFSIAFNPESPWLLFQDRGIRYEEEWSEVRSCLTDRNRAKVITEQLWLHIRGRGFFSDGATK